METLPGFFRAQMSPLYAALFVVFCIGAALTLVSLVAILMSSPAKAKHRGKKTAYIFAVLLAIGLVLMAPMVAAQISPGFAGFLGV
ncbi:MAG: hypothetical protein ACK5L3_01415 [Oscillospiraceae bacterium]